MSDKEVRFKWSDVKSLILVWLLAIFVSFCALTTSVAALYVDRKEWSCQRDGHYYEARYSVYPTDKETLQAIGAEFKDWHHLKLKALKNAERSIYEGDICRYCGQRLDKVK